jgi:hypothetical protein
MANDRKVNVTLYATVIERYLKNEDISHSESEIAREVLSVTLDTNDDLPSSTNDLDKFTEIKESLRMLLSQGKIFQTLVQDPFTKEETAYYGFRKDRK